MRGKAAVALLALLAPGCAARGHVATPDEVASLRQADGLSASGRIVLSGSRGKFSTRVVFGVSKPDSLRIEIPAGTGLRFLLVAKDGRLRADLPEDDAMFEGAATREVMSELFGMDVSPAELVGAILGSPPSSLEAGWRFDRNRPTRVTLRGPSNARLTLDLDDPEIAAPQRQAFDFGPPRARSWSLAEMSERLGIRR